MKAWTFGTFGRADFSTVALVPTTLRTINPIARDWLLCPSLTAKPGDLR